MTCIFSLTKPDKEKVVENIAVAIKDGNFEYVDEAIREGWIDPNTEIVKGRTLLMISARRGPLQTITLLVSKGAIIDTDSLAAAAALGRIDVVRFFLEMNADSTKKTEIGYDALDYARFYGKKEIEEMILEHRKKCLRTGAAS